MNPHAPVNGYPRINSNTRRIYQHLRSLEVDQSRWPLHDYMEDVQNEITPLGRGSIVNWLVRVADGCNLVSDTLYLTVNYVDRFLSSQAWIMNKFPLLCIASMLVASKIEEVTPPTIQDFCDVTGNIFTREEVVTMERQILSVLNVDLCNPTPKSFIRIFSRASPEIAFLGSRFEFLVCYITELSLIDYSCVRFLPSMIAASAIFLAKFTMLPDDRPWGVALHAYTGYKASNLYQSVVLLHDLQHGRWGMDAQAVREKYMRPEFESVATLTSRPAIPQHYFE